MKTSLLAVALLAFLSIPAHAADLPGSTPTAETKRNNVTFIGTVTHRGPVVLSGTTGPTFTGAKPTFNTGVWVDAGTMINSTLMVDGGLTVGLQGGPITGIIPFSATIDFTASSGGMAYSSAITVAGAAANGSCVLGPTTAAAALLGAYGCYVTGANEVKAWFLPASQIQTTCTLGGESPSVCPAQTVVASSVCTASNVGTSAAIAAAGVAVSLSGTTLTLTSANSATNVVNYSCRAPVDPASGTFEGAVFLH